MDEEFDKLIEQFMADHSDLSKKQESDDISQDEFTNFVNALNKIKKKGEEGNAAE